MKRFDALIIALVVVLSLAALIPFLSDDGELVRIEQNGILLYQGPIDEDKLIEAEGNTIMIQDGKVTVSESSCPDGLCKKGECTRLHPLICLPNKLSVTIVSKGDSLDAISS